MDVFLDGIKFNHDPTSASSDADVGRNASHFVPVSEWQLESA
jgi:hypothetical protein